MSANSDNGPNFLNILAALASIATIIGVVIAYFAYVHPISSSSDSSVVSSGGSSGQSSGGSGQSGNGGQSSGGSRQSGSIDISGAKSTVQAFCEYLNSGAMQNAYNLTSSSYQSQHTIDQFTSQFNGMDLNNGGCEYNAATASGSTVTIPITVHRIDINNGGTTSTTNYTATLNQPSQVSSWVIDTIQ